MKYGMNEVMQLLAQMVTTSYWYALPPGTGFRPGVFPAAYPRQIYSPRREIQALYTFIIDTPVTTSRVYITFKIRNKLSVGVYV